MYSKTTCKCLNFILVLKVIKKDFLETIGDMRGFYSYDSELIFRK